MNATTTVASASIARPDDGTGGTGATDDTGGTDGAHGAQGTLCLAATLMRGGTSKGLFLLQTRLPAAVRGDPALRDRLLRRLIGSPDPYGAQIDGLGGGTSSTSKVVLVAPSARPGHDVDYLFGAVAIGQPLIDWSGNCGNLSAAVGPFAIAQGLVPAPRDGLATVRLWQANIGKTIVAHVPMQGGAVLEAGDFMLDGVAFPAAAIELEFLDPGGGDGGEGGVPGPLLPTGRAVDLLAAPDGTRVEATLINAGNPTVFVDARAIGLTGLEMQPDVNANPALLDRLETLRAQAAVVMGLAGSTEEATRDRPATPKLCFVAPPADYRAADGRRVHAADIDLLARILSMGRLHHAMTGTGGVAIAAAASIPGTLVQRLLPAAPPDGRVRFGHPSGTLSVAAQASRGDDGRWRIDQVSMTRSARRLMQGSVFVPWAEVRGTPGA
jgi:probable AcnD-accessory protein PrpF